MTNEKKLDNPINHWTDSRKRDDIVAALRYVVRSDSEYIGWVVLCEQALKLIEQHEATIDALTECVKQLQSRVDDMVAEMHHDRYNTESEA